MIWSPSILLIEDQPEEFERVLELLRDLRIGDRVQVVENWDAALLFLRQRPPFTYVSQPDLVMLDLDLAGGRGQELLDELSADPQLTNLPVVVLTSLARQAGGAASSSLHGIAGCLVKPILPGRLGVLLRVLEARLASRGRQAPLVG
jgi:two-component system response regulator